MKRRAAGLLAVACALGAPGLVRGASAPAAADSLEARIGLLRRAGDYAAAAQPAEALLALRRADPSARPHETGDALRLRAWVAFAASLPAGDRRQLAQADSLDPPLDDCYAGGRPAEGLALAERQHQLRERVLGSADPETAASLRRRGLFLIELGQYAEARTLIRRALDVQSRLLGEDHPAVGSGLCEIAAVHEWLGEYDEAEALYADGLARLRRSVGPDHPEIASALDLMGVLAQSRDDYDRAAELHREAVEMLARVRGRQHPDYAAALQNLATVFLHQGHYAQATLLYREALTVTRRARGDAHPDVAVALHNLAGTLEAQGRLAEAEERFREVVELTRGIYGEDHPYRATALSHLSGLYRRRGRLAEARGLLREALRIQRAAMGAENPFVAATLRELALVESDGGEHAAADSLLEEALRVDAAVSGEQSLAVADDLGQMAASRLARGESGAARDLLRRTLAIRRALLGETHPAFSADARELGTLLLAEGEPAEAARLLAESARGFEIARRRVSPGLGRATFQRSPYGALCAALLAQGKPAEAWIACERDRARLLADLVTQTGGRDLAPGEAQREDFLRAAVDRLEGQLAALRADGGPERHARAAEGVREALLAAEAEWIEFQRELAARHPVGEGEPFDLARVQRAIARDEALIGWADLEYPTRGASRWGYVLRDRGPVRWFRLKEDAGAARAAVLRRLLVPGAGLPLARRPGPEMREAARALWQERVAPLAGELRGARSLIVVPSGPLLGLPLEALADDEGLPLGERYQVSYAPSGTVHAWLAERSARRRRSEAPSLLLVGDPPLLSSVSGETRGADLAALPAEEATRQLSARGAESLRRLSPLPWSRGELEEIAALAPGSTLLAGAAASEANVAELARSGRIGTFDIVHFATHAIMDDERPERSALVLSQRDLPDPVAAALEGRRIEDGILEAAEMAREWKLDADLVTLSACDTGLGQLVPGEGYVGLSQVLFQAGARSLLVSLWSVSDRATALLMRRFYENLLVRRETRRGALQEAKRWLRSYRDERGDLPYEHPYYWAGFILLGDPR